MRVNVSKAYISKTLMNGLKVLSKLSKSNKKKSFEFKLKFIQVIKKTLASSVSLAAATFAAAIIVLSVNILLDIVVFCRLTVLMNDFRLKTFYCKLTKQPPTSSTTTTTKTLSPTTLSSSLSSASTTSSNINHNRTYNNSSKSNKVFLYYTPRDPRLRIFSKTKHLFNRPKFHLHSQISFLSAKADSNNYNCCANSQLKISDDLCNYGELIGGGVSRNNSKNRSSCQNKTKRVVNKTSETIVCKTNSNSVKSSKLNTTTVCDNLTKNKTSDNRVVAASAAAAAVISTSSALAGAAAVVCDNIANIIITIFVVALKYTEDFLKSLGSLLSFFNNYPLLKVLNEKRIFGISKNFL